MSSGSAPTVSARMSSVSTSHSFNRFGYWRCESSLRGTLPVPDFAAVPSTVCVHPGQHDQTGQSRGRTCQCAAGAHLEFTIDWRVSSLATSHASGKGSSA